MPAAEAQQGGPVLVELKPNRNLLDPNFNGYKLSLEKLPTFVEPIKSGVDRAQATEQQFSLQHVKHFAVHNHIFSDPCNPFVVYIVDKLWAVLRVSIDFVTGRLDVISPVWSIPATENKKDGRFNVTISFPDGALAVVSDGCEALYIVKTGDRKSSEPWNPIMAMKPFENTQSSSQFSLLDCTKYKVGNDACIDVMAARIDDKSVWTDALAHLNDRALEERSFLTVLEWFTFQGEGVEETKWTLKSSRTLIGHSGTDYAYLEPGGTGMYLASDSRFHMVVDSDRPINLQVASSVSTGDEKKPDYLWTQTMSEVKLWFKVKSSIKKEDVDVVFKRDFIMVSHKGQLILEGALQKSTNIEGSYWIIDTPKCVPENVREVQDAGNDNGDPVDQYKTLEIVLEKEEEGVAWMGDVVRNSFGEYVTDPEFSAAVHARLAHLCSDKWGDDPGQSDAYDPRQLEECDAYPADSSCLTRIDRNTQKISHVASLGSHQWLFNVRVEPNTAPAICIRHDVDGVVWKPRKETNPESPEVTWNCEHVGTFSALGYVQASKQQRKYTLCSPDISYVAICDVKKHIYVYRQPTKIESCLRNRRTGEHVTHVAKQLVISLDPPQDILGAYATPSYLYVLTPQNFHAIRILAEEE